MFRARSFVQNSRSPDILSFGVGARSSLDSKQTQRCEEPSSSCKTRTQLGSSGRWFGIRLSELHVAVEERVPGLKLSYASRQLGASASSHHLGGKERHVLYSATWTTYYLGRYVLLPRHLDILARLVCRKSSHSCTSSPSNFTNVPLLDAAQQCRHNPKDGERLQPRVRPLPPVQRPHCLAVFPVV